MKTSAGGWARVKGPFVIASTMMLAMTIFLFSAQVIVKGPTAGAWVPETSLSENGTSIDSSLMSGPEPFYNNITGKILEEMARNATGGPCYDYNTNSTKVVGFPENVEVLTLSTNVVHKFWLHSYNTLGERRCAGGDFYELDLSSSLWKSRPPIEDLQNGTYEVQFMVPDIYAGSFNFSAFLLFDAYHGLDFDGAAFAKGELTAFLRIDFVTPANYLEAEASISSDDLLTGLKRCDPASDFTRHEWSGRWSRPVDNDTSCMPDVNGRYSHCFSNAANITCRNPSWCSGNVSKLESIGWSYSAHCAFHIFEAQEAWDCLAGRWLFFSGDSNHQDTIRNLVFFILQPTPPPGRDLLRHGVDRSMQTWFRNPANVDQEVRITNHFNGHPLVSGDDVGLGTWEDPVFRKHIKESFTATRYPDTVIMNSGLRDGLRHWDVAKYVKSVDSAVAYWSELLGNVTGAPPQLIYRTTVAPAGVKRGGQANAQKLEVYNRIMTEKVQARFAAARFVDSFDMSFPFHYDNNYSDGEHYGQAPDGKHLYFVDIALGHVLLNAICPHRAS